jgi:hypothetical protein
MPFIKGKSGNPAGRRKGTGTISPSVMRECRIQFTEMTCNSFEEWAPMVIQKAIDLAKAGNEKMITMLWDRFFNPSILNISIQSSTASDIADSQGLIIEKMGDGTLDRTHALDLIKGLAIKRDSIITKDLEKAVQAIQENHKG